MKLQISGSPMNRELPDIKVLWISEWYTQYQVAQILGSWSLHLNFVW